MNIPSYDKMMLPLLQYAGERGDVLQLKNMSDVIGDYFDLTADERNELLDSGQTIIYNRVGWAKTYLTKAGLLESTGRGKFRITERGYAVLEDNPDHIDRKYLKQFKSFQEFQQRSTNNIALKNTDSDTSDDEKTPEEIIESTYHQLRQGLNDDLIDVVLSLSPTFFERMVVDLLLAMGYGSTLDSGERIGRSGDGGIDGIIREDKLGLDTIYIQAKRYDRNNGVGRPAIQAFAGSLMGEGASKGVFITTSYFSSQAWQYADSLTNLKVILIDGEQLGKLLIEHNVGVSVKKTYTIKQIDENYFPDV